MSRVIVTNDTVMMICASVGLGIWKPAGGGGGGGARARPGGTAWSEGGACVRERVYARERRLCAVLRKGGVHAWKGVPPPPADGGAAPKGLAGLAAPPAEAERDVAGGGTHTQNALQHTWNVSSA